MDNQNLDKTPGALVFKDEEVPVHYRLGAWKDGVLFAPYNAIRKAFGLGGAELQRPGKSSLRIDVAVPELGSDEVRFTVSGVVE